jgi:hypothetical protein
MTGYFSSVAVKIEAVSIDIFHSELAQMAVAKDLLRRHDVALAEVAEHVGYGDAARGDSNAGS